MRGFLLALSLLITGVIAQTRIGDTQEPDKQISAPSAKVASVHADRPSHFELLHTRYGFENDGTGRKEVTARIRILNEKGVLQRSEQTFDYKPFSEQLEIPYVRIVKRDGTVVNVIKGEVVQRPKIPSIPGLPDFDYDEKRIAVPGLSPGDALEYKVAIVIRQPLARGQFWAQYKFQPSVVSDEQLEIDIPCGRAVKVKANPGIDAWTGGDNKRQIYHWRSLNPTLEDQQFTINPQQEPPDVQLSSFANWEEVGRWYADLEKTRRIPSAEVRAKADELTKGLTADLEKVEALYDFAAKKIRYISFVSLGVGGYVPTAADEVLRKGNGDCKDKVALLSALLEAEGMHASSVLISPNLKLDLDIPSPSPFNHVIAMLQLGKDEIWMDPSSAVLPFRMLEYHVRKKQGLVMPPDAAPRFEETPANSPVPNTWLEEVDGKVSENGTLDATVSITARGDAELLPRQVFLAPVESMWPVIVQGAVKGINRKADKVSDVKISDPKATNEPFTLSFRVSKPFFLDLLKGVTELRLPLSDYPLSSLEGDSAGERPHAASEPVLLGPPSERTYKIRLELPQGFKPEIPSDFVLERDYGVYQASYKLEGNFMMVERKLTMRKDELPSALAEDYSAFRKKVLADSKHKMLVEVAPHATTGQK